MKRGEGRPSTVWDLYRGSFQDGEQVIVLDDNERLHWGRLETCGEHGLRLHRPGRTGRLIPWGDIDFMAQDGFPARKLTGAEGSESILKLSTTNVARTLRRILST